MGIHHSWGQEMGRIFLFTFPLLSLEVFGLLKRGVDIPIRTSWRRGVKKKEGHEILSSKAFRVEGHIAEPLVYP